MSMGTHRELMIRDGQIPESPITGNNSMSQMREVDGPGFMPAETIWLPPENAPKKGN